MRPTPNHCPLKSFIFVPIRRQRTKASAPGTTSPGSFTLTHVQLCYPTTLSPSTTPASLPPTAMLPTSSSTTGSDSKLALRVTRQRRKRRSDVRGWNSLPQTGRCLERLGPRNTRNERVDERNSPRRDRPPGDQLGGQVVPSTSDSAETMSKILDTVRNNAGCMAQRAAHAASPNDSKRGHRLGMRRQQYKRTKKNVPEAFYPPRAFQTILGQSERALPPRMTQHDT